MKSIKALISLLIVVMLVFIASGCGKEKASNADKSTKTEETTSTIKITDDLDRTVEFAKDPEKIIPLSPTILNVLYDVGGVASARPNKSSTPMPKKAEKLEEVGQHFNVNIEKLISLKPDLVIGQIGLHEKFIPILEENNIPVVIFDIETYEDSIDKIAKISKIAGTEEKGTALIEKINKKIKAIKEELPNEKKRVAIVYVTSQDVTVELDKTVAGDAAKILKFENVALSTRTKDMVRSPFSMEELVKQDPDIIFVTSRSMAEGVKLKKNTALLQNPAWAELRAVKEGNVYDLPADLFVVCPATSINEPIEYMAKLAYPEVYGHVKN